jgi:small subunit ribosomal protein S29
MESSWIVIYIPRAINLVDSSSPYAYSETLQTYLQPAIARSILERILAINGDLLSRIETGDGSVTLDRDVKIKPHSKLTEVIREGLKTSASPAATQQILEITLKTLVQQKEVPVLMAIDGVQALFSQTMYRDADYKQLKSYQLAVPRLLQACLRKSGPGSFGGVQRGMTLTASSLQHKEWPLPIEMESALRLKKVDPYTKLDETMLSILQDCDLEKLEFGLELTRPEAASLFAIAKQEGGMWNMANDEFFMAKLMESGGNLGVFDRSLRGSIV